MITLRKQSTVKRHAKSEKQKNRDKTSFRRINTSQWTQHCQSWPGWISDSACKTWRGQERTVQTFPGGVTSSRSAVPALTLPSFCAQSDRLKKKFYQEQNEFGVEKNVIFTQGTEVSKPRKEKMAFLRLTCYSWWVTSAEVRPGLEIKRRFLAGNFDESGEIWPVFIVIGKRIAHPRSAGDQAWRRGENAWACRAALGLEKFARADHHDI